MNLYDNLDLGVNPIANVTTLGFANSGFTAVLAPTTLTTNRVLTIPNKTGVIALISDIVGDGDGIYTASGTVPTSVVSTITDNYTMSGSGDALMFYAEASTGRIGYGTNSPSAKMHVKGTGTGVALFENFTGMTLLNLEDNGSFTLGYNSTTLGVKNVVVGSGLTPTDDEQILIGSDHTPLGAIGHIMIGKNNTITDSTAGSSVMVGNDQNTAGYRTVLIGDVATVTADFGVAIGATSTSADGVAVGYLANAHSQAVAVGRECVNNAKWAIAIGYAAETALAGISMGYTTSSTGSYAIAIGTAQTLNTGTDGISLGRNTYVTGVDGISMGRAAFTSGLNAISMGRASKAVNNESIAIGAGTATSANGAIMMGVALTPGTDFVTNSVGNSVGFGWDEATPSILFAKTADQYIAGTGGLGIGTKTPNASAKLEVSSTTKGFRLRPMTATQASAITVAEGLMVCVSDTNGTFTSIGFWGYENAAWAKL